MNDTEREEWVCNDEFLWTMWRMSRRPMRKFLRENRKSVDERINEILNKPPAR